MSNSPTWEKFFFSKIPDSEFCVSDKTSLRLVQKDTLESEKLSAEETKAPWILMRLKMRHKGGALALHQVHIGILLVFFLKCVVFVGRNRTTTGKDTTSLSDESESELLSAVESGSCSLTAIAAVNSIWWMITTSLFHITIS